MPIYTEDEQGIARRNPLFIFLRQVIVHTACYGKSWKKQNKRLHLATHGFMHQLQTISLLSPINIIFEKLLYNRLYTYLEQFQKGSIYNISNIHAGEHPGESKKGCHYLYYLLWPV